MSRPRDEPCRHGHQLLARASYTFRTNGSRGCRAARAPLPAADEAVLFAPGATVLVQEGPPACARLSRVRAGMARVAARCFAHMPSETATFRRYRFDEGTLAVGNVRPVTDSSIARGDVAPLPARDLACHLLAVGSGASGVAAAVTAANQGLRALATRGRSSKARPSPLELGKALAS